MVLVPLSTSGVLRWCRTEPSDESSLMMALLTVRVLAVVATVLVKTLVALMLVPPLER